MRLIKAQQQNLCVILRSVYESTGRVRLGRENKQNKTKQNKTTQNKQHNSRIAACLKNNKGNKKNNKI